MTKPANEQLLLIADAIVEDILNMSDEEILAEAKEEGIDVSSEADRLRELFDEAELRVNKEKLRNAQEQVQRMRNNQTDAVVIDADKARRVLARIQRSDSSIYEELMLAARKANRSIDDLPDEEVLSLVNDLKELGLWYDDEHE